MVRHASRTVAAVVAAAAVVLAGCGALPIKVGLQDVSVDLGVIANTQGYVLYPAAPSVFQRSDLHVARATVDGDVAASGLTGATDFTFFGRATDPAADADCRPVANLGGSYVACPSAGEQSISGVVQLPQDGSARAVHFGGSVLAAAANQGRVWVGATVAGNVSTNATLAFTHLVASVVLL